MGGPVRKRQVSEASRRFLAWPQAQRVAASDACKGTPRQYVGRGAVCTALVSRPSERSERDPGPRSSRHGPSMLRSALLPLGPGSRSARAEEALAALARDTRVLPLCAFGSRTSERSERSSPAMTPALWTLALWSAHDLELLPPPAPVGFRHVDVALGIDRDRVAVR